MFHIVYSIPNIFDSNQLRIDTTTDPMNAATNVETVNPVINCAKNQKIKPFTTNENNPSVMMVKGSVTILIIGLISMLINTKHAPTMNVTQNGAILIPSITEAVAKTARLIIIQWSNNFIVN